MPAALSLLYAAAPRQCCWPAHASPQCGEVQGNFSEVPELGSLTLQDLSVTFDNCSAGQWAGMLQSLQAAFPVSPSHGRARWPHIWKGCLDEHHGCAG